MTETTRERVAAHDAIWLQDSAANPMIINAVCTLDSVGVDEIRRLWSERVLDGPRRERFARLRRRVVRLRSGFAWEEDPRFDVARHVREAATPRVEGQEGLERLVSELAPRPLPDDRPPWEVLVVPDCGDGASAMIVRLHHVLGDGMGLLPVLFSLLDDYGDSLVRPAPVVRARPGVVRRALTGPLSVPWLVLRRAFSSPDRSALHGQALSGVKRVAWSRPLELGVWREARLSLGATVNDLLTAAVGGAIRRVLRQHGDEHVEAVRASVPVSVRPPGEPPRLENCFATVFLPVPLAPAGLAERVAATKRAMDRLKGSVEPLAMYFAVSAALGLLPDGVSRRLVDHLANRCTLVMTNVPGPSGRLAMGGRAVREMVFWVPQRAGIGLGVSLFSHGGRLVVGVMSDAAVLEDPRRLLAAIDAELGELAALGQS